MAAMKAFTTLFASLQLSKPKTAPSSLLRKAEDGAPAITAISMWCSKGRPIMAQAGRPLVKWPPVVTVPGETPQQYTTLTRAQMAVCGYSCVGTMAPLTNGVILTVGATEKYTHPIAMIMALPGQRPMTSPAPWYPLLINGMRWALVTVL